MTNNERQACRQNELACTACAAYSLNLCEAAAAVHRHAGSAERIQIDQTAHVTAARRIICRDKDLQHAVPVICSGWAASIAMLSDGSRQILSFLLPGDLVSTALLFGPRRQGLVEAITEVGYRMFKRSELKAALLKHPALFDKVSAFWLDERDRADQLITDLGRRSADERIARLILNLAERLGRRGMTRETASTIEMEFPLRQHHVADATGLTPVHVSKVLSTLRRNGLIKISDRTLTIADLVGFRQIAHAR